MSGYERDPYERALKRVSSKLGEGMRLSRAIDKAQSGLGENVEEGIIPIRPNESSLEQGLLALSIIGELEQYPEQERSDLFL